MIALFDYTKLVFSKNEKEWKALKNTDKSRNFFMLQRFCSIKFPVQAAILSYTKVDAVAVSDYWHKTMSNLYNSTPAWIYAKTIKKEESKKIDMPSAEMIRWYCNKNEISEKEFSEKVSFFKEEFLKEVKSLEKILKSQGII